MMKDFKKTTQSVGGNKLRVVGFNYLIRRWIGFYFINDKKYNASWDEFGKFAQRRKPHLDLI